MPTSSEQEVLALAITNEEEDSRIYRGFAEGLREHFPASAKMFDEMAEEEVRHRTMLFDLYRKKFGEYLPLIRRQDVKGFVRTASRSGSRGRSASTRCANTPRRWNTRPRASTARPRRRTRDASVRELLIELAEAEDKHESLAHELERDRS